MELMGVIRAIEVLPPGEYITIITDSQYVVMGTKGKWRLNANLDLWQRLFNLMKEYKVVFLWRRNRSDDMMRKVDNLVVKEARNCQLSTESRADVGDNTVPHYVGGVLEQDI